MILEALVQILLIEFYGPTDFELTAFAPGRPTELKNCQLSSKSKRAIKAAILFKAYAPMSRSLSTEGSGAERTGRLPTESVVPRVRCSKMEFLR